MEDPEIEVIQDEFSEANKSTISIVITGNCWGWQAFRDPLLHFNNGENDS